MKERPWKAWLPRQSEPFSRETLIYIPEELMEFFNKRFPGQPNNEIKAHHIVSLKKRQKSKLLLYFWKNERLKF
jgi:hypothetical protein